MATNNVTNTYISIGSGKELTMPAQPAFLATLSSQQANVSGNGAAYSFVCDTEIFDQNLDYDNGTGIFTAPVTGRYILCAKSYMSGASACVGGRTQIVTSNRLYFSGYLKPASNADILTDISIIADMDAADTAYPQAAYYGESSNILDLEPVSGADTRTLFSGYLAC